MEQSPEEHLPTSKPPTKEAGWDVTYLDEQRRAVEVKRITVEEVKRCDGVVGAVIQNEPDNATDVGRIACSGCDREWSTFKVPHDPHECEVAHREPHVRVDERNARLYGPPRALPLRRTRRGREKVRREFGVGVE